MQESYRDNTLINLPEKAYPDFQEDIQSNLGKGLYAEVLDPLMGDQQCQMRALYFLLMLEGYVPYNETNIYYSRLLMDCIHSNYHPETGLMLKQTTCYSSLRIGDSNSKKHKLSKRIKQVLASSILEELSKTIQKYDIQHVKETIYRLTNPKHTTLGVPTIDCFTSCFLFYEISRLLKIPTIIKIFPYIAIKPTSVSGNSTQNWDFKRLPTSYNQVNWANGNLEFIQDISKIYSFIQKPILLIELFSFYDSSKELSTFPEKSKRILQQIFIQRNGLHEINYEEIFLIQGTIHNQFVQTIQEVYHSDDLTKLYLKYMNKAHKEYGIYHLDRKIILDEKISDKTLILGCYHIYISSIFEQKARPNLIIGPCSSNTLPSRYLESGG